MWASTLSPGRGILQTASMRDGKFAHDEAMSFRCQCVLFSKLDPIKYSSFGQESTDRNFDSTDKHEHHPSSVSSTDNVWQIVFICLVLYVFNVDKQYKPGDSI